MLRLKTFTKKALDIFWFQVQDFNNSDIFYKIQNLKKWQIKAVVPFLPRNLKLHSPCHFREAIQLKKRFLLNVVQKWKVTSSIVKRTKLLFFFDLNWHKIVRFAYKKFIKVRSCTAALQSLRIYDMNRATLLPLHFVPCISSLLWPCNVWLSRLLVTGTQPSGDRYSAQSF